MNEIEEGKRQAEAMRLLELHAHGRMTRDGYVEIGGALDAIMQAIRKSDEQRAELLEALQGLVNVSDQYTGDDVEDAAIWYSAYNRADAAIANATQQRNATGGEGNG